MPIENEVLLPPPISLGIPVVSMYSNHPKSKLRTQKMAERSASSTPDSKVLEPRGVFFCVAWSCLRNFPFCDSASGPCRVKHGTTVEADAPVLFFWSWGWRSHHVLFFENSWGMWFLGRTCGSPWFDPQSTWFLKMFEKNGQRTSHPMIFLRFFEGEIHQPNWWI